MYEGSSCLHAWIIHVWIGWLTIVVVIHVMVSQNFACKIIDVIVVRAELFRVP